MRQDDTLAAFLDIAVGQAVKECAIIEAQKMKTVDAMALFVFKFAAVASRSVETAERAEADYRKRVAVLGGPSSKAGN